MNPLKNLAVKKNLPGVLNLESRLRWPRPGRAGPKDFQGRCPLVKGLVLAGFTGGARLPSGDDRPVGRASAAG